MSERIHEPRVLDMTRPALVGLVLLLLGCPSESGSNVEVGTPEDGTSERSGPAVVMIVLDAASAFHFTLYGGPKRVTPNIDRFARGCVVFDNHYSQSPTTGPSTAALVNGVRYGSARRPETSGLPKIAELFSLTGMLCDAVIANPNASNPRIGLNRGYDQYIEVYRELNEELEKTPGVERKGGYPVPRPEDVTRFALDLLPRWQEGSFFAYLHYLQPHKPYDPPDEYLRRFEPSRTGDCDCGGIGWPELEQKMERADKAGEVEPHIIRHAIGRYRATLAYVDAEIGRLLKRLRNEPWYDESLVVLTSDHGEAFFDHKRFGHNFTVYDDMTRIPLLMKFPASWNVEPRRIGALTETVDVLPTLLEFADLPVPAHVEGLSLLPLCVGEADELVDGSEVVIATSGRGARAIREGTRKFIYKGKDAEPELYDLATDPTESQNLAATESGTGELGRWRKILRAYYLRPGVEVEKGNVQAMDPEMEALLRELGYVGGEEDG